MSRNAAILMVSGRKKILPKTLKLFHENWNNHFKYPIYIYDIGNVYTDRDIKFYEIKYENLKFVKVFPKIPSNIHEKELFYNRTKNLYVKKNFDKRRLGYLHMIYFKSNMSLFGEWKCEEQFLKQYDYLMIIDDDSWFKKKIEFDFFDKLDEFPLATAVSGIYEEKNLSRVRENLLKFIKNFINEENIEVKNQSLKDILKYEDDDALTKLTYSIGNLDLFDLRVFRSQKYQKYIQSVNNFGGQYKYRWGDIEITNLFVHLYYENGIFNFNLSEDVYGPQHPGTKPVYFNQNKYLVFRLILRIFEKIKSIFN